MAVPTARIRVLNERPPDPNGEFVLYWMTSARRFHWNFGLQRAVDLAIELRRPLLVLEALRCDYPHASDRLHRFVLEGMAVNAREAARTRAMYHPYVEPDHQHGRGLIRALSRRACVIVTDWYPAFFIPAMIAGAARQSRARLEAVDSNGLIPLADHGRTFTVARSYRAFLQRTIRHGMPVFPEESPLQRLARAPRLGGLPRDLTARWPPASSRLLAGDPAALARIPVDHAVQPGALRGGRHQAVSRLAAFVTDALPRYADEHNHPDDECTSRLSPYLHFGHISAHEVFSAVMTHERWTTRRISKPRGGARDGWWGVSPSAEAFLDQLLVWRELSFNASEYMRDYTSYDSLPEWARRTLDQHETDERPHIYSIARLESAGTHDDIWNAAQRQLATEGWFHGYLRMLWGKKILEWCAHPAQALERMRLLMDRYSLDGRDPNSYAGYAWVLGRYDRPWPERPVFGTVRYMSSASTRRKLRITRYLERYSADTTGSARSRATRR
jgi:deoxyribodipyrimidine photo-lyase